MKFDQLMDKVIGITMILLLWVIGAAFIVTTVKFCRSDDSQLFIDGGLGAFGTRGSSLSQVKFAKIGYQEELWYNLKYRLNGGMWLDNRGSDYSNSAFAGPQLGFEVTNNIFQAGIFSGPTLIANPDEDLGGHVQFNESLFLGIVDKQCNSIGIDYNHFSSAGIEMPNKGRDFICLQIKFGI